MNTDHYYEIGHKHEICEDYAASGLLGELAFAFVSDGCSASTDVDFGSRALIFAAKDALLNGMAFAKAEDLGDFIIGRAEQAGKVFASMHPLALDATLLMTVANEERVRLLMFGDGVFIIRRPDGLTVVEVEYAPTVNDNPAPFYLSYQLDLERLKNYANSCGKPKTIRTTTCDGPLKAIEIKTVVETVPYDRVTELSFRREEVTMAAVVSDGIGTFREGDDTRIDCLDMIDDFTLYKTTKGSFQQRRMMSLKRECRERMRTHGDDISIATIIVQPDFFKVQ